MYVVRAAHLTKIGGPFMNSFLRSSQNSSGDSWLLLIAFMSRAVSCTLVYRSAWCSCYRNQHSCNTRSRVRCEIGRSRGEYADVNRENPRAGSGVHICEADSRGRRSGKMHTDGFIPTFLVPFVSVDVVEHARDVRFEVLHGRTFLWREIFELDSHIFLSRVVEGER